MFSVSVALAELSSETVCCSPFVVQIASPVSSVLDYFRSFSVFIITLYCLADLACSNAAALNTHDDDLNDDIHTSV